MPVYSFELHQRTAETQYLYGASVIIIEGIFVLSDPELRKLMDMKIFGKLVDELIVDLEPMRTSLQCNVIRILCSHDAYNEIRSREGEMWQASSLSILHVIRKQP